MNIFILIKKIMYGFYQMINMFVQKYYYLMNGVKNILKN